MAFVIVSAGHVTDSRTRTVRARPVLTALVAATLVLMAACLALGFKLAQLAAPAVAAPSRALGEPELSVIANRVGALAGRLALLEQETAILARRLGTIPLAAALDPGPRAG
jgi:hypothetical protein